MTSYNSLSQKFYAAAFLAGMILTAAGCHKQDPYTTTNGATFYVDTLTADFTPDSLKENMVSRKYVNYTACLKDNAGQASIMDLKFQVQAGNYSVTKTTDDRGCLVWQELVTYTSAQNNEIQVGLTRLITGVQGHSGTVDVEINYDPDGDKIVYLKRESARSSDPVTVTYSAGGPVQSTDLASNNPITVSVDFQMKIDSQAKLDQFVNDVSLQFMDRDFANYRVDPTLSLTIAHKYRLKLSDAIIRKTLAAGTTTSPITDGHFKIYIALLKEGYNAPGVAPTDLVNYVVSANEMDATDYLGALNADVSMQFTDIAALASRLTAAVTVVSIDHPDIYNDGSFEGIVSPIGGGSSMSGIDVVPSTTLNAESLFAAYQTNQTQQSSVNPLELFAQQSGFSPMQRSPIQFAATAAPAIAPAAAPAQASAPPARTGLFGKLFTPPGIAQPAARVNTNYGNKNYNVDLYWLMKKIKSGQSLSSDEADGFAKAVCWEYFHGNTNWLDYGYNQCLQNAGTMMMAEVRQFVDKINDPVPKQQGPPQVETLTIAMGLNFSQSSEDSNSAQKGNTRTLYNVGWEADAGLGISLGGNKGLGGAVLGKVLGLNGSIGAKVSASTGQQWFSSTSVTHADTNSQTNSMSVSTSTGVTVSSEGFTFAIDANVKTCLIIAPSPAMEKILNGYDHPAGKYFCGDEVERQNRNETYYFLNESTGLSSSPLADNFSAQDNPWRMFIRGKTAYSLYKTLFQTQGLTLQLNKMPDEDILKKFNAFYITQEFPGLLTE